MINEIGKASWKVTLCVCKLDLQKIVLLEDKWSNHLLQAEFTIDQQLNMFTATHFTCLTACHTL